MEFLTALFLGKAVWIWLVFLAIIYNLVKTSSDTEPPKPALTQ